MHSPFTQLEGLFQLASDSGIAIGVSVAAALVRLFDRHPKRQWVIRDDGIGYHAEKCWPTEELEHQLDKAWERLNTQDSQ